METCYIDTNACLNTKWNIVTKFQPAFRTHVCTTGNAMRFWKDSIVNVLTTHLEYSAKVSA